MGKWRMKEHFSAQSIGKTIGLLLLGLAVLGLFTTVLTGLWNWLLPDLFGVKTITPLQGFGIFILSKIIFGSFAGRSNDDTSGHHKLRGNDDVILKQGVDSNSAFEQLYEAWWSSEGERQFELYAEKNKKKE